MASGLTRTADGVELLLPARRSIWSAVAIGYGILLVTGGFQADWRELTGKQIGVVMLLVAGLVLMLAVTFFAVERLSVTRAELRAEWMLFSLKRERVWLLADIERVWFDSDTGLTIKVRDHLLQASVTQNIDRVTAEAVINAMQGWE